MTDLVILDIETTGLSSQDDRTTLVGLCHYRSGSPDAPGKMEYRQSALKDEKALLVDTFGALHELETKSDRLVTFFGKGFDVPFLIDRARAVGLKPPESVLDWMRSEVRHVDLASKVWHTPALKKFLPVPGNPENERMSKNRLSRILDIQVPFNMDGAACALSGKAWLEAPDSFEENRAMTRIVEHNLIDLTTTLKIHLEFERRGWL